MLASQIRGHYNSAFNSHDLLPMENGCLGCCAANTSYHLTDDNCSEQSEILLNRKRLNQAENIVDDSTVGYQTARMTNVPVKVSDHKKLRETVCSRSSEGQVKKDTTFLERPHMFMFSKVRDRMKTLKGRQKDRKGTT